MKALGKMWSSLQKNDKAIFEEFAKRDKKRYDSEMFLFKERGGDIAKLNDIERIRPKKCLSAYMIFVRETRSKIKADNMDMPVLDIMKEVGRQW